MHQLEQLLNASTRVLITSHISPDPDAVCSALLLGETLKTNFPDKKIQISLDEKTSSDLSFLHGYDEIEFENLLTSAQELKPDLLIIVDASSIPRVSRNQASELQQLVRQLGTKIIVIDHHPEDGKTVADLYIRGDKPATAQQIYELCFDELKLERPEGYAETALLGILRDTGRFKYDNPDYKNTFRVVDELIEAGASIEKLEYRLDRFNKDEFEVLAHLLQNAYGSGNGCSVSFISDEFAEQWQADDRPETALKSGCDIFGSQYLRNLDENYWGFTVYPELKSENKTYSVSFRSVSGNKDVSAMAAKLGGGGHVQAAGAKNIQAESIKDAIEKIQQAIE